MADTFPNAHGGITGPAINAAAITPSAAELAAHSRAIYVGVTGDVTVTMQGGQSITLEGVQGGSFLPIRVSHITAATASGIVSFW